MGGCPAGISVACSGAIFPTKVTLETFVRQIVQIMNTAPIRYVVLPRRVLVLVPRLDWSCRPPMAASPPPLPACKSMAPINVKHVSTRSILRAMAIFRKYMVNIIPKIVTIASIHLMVLSFNSISLSLYPSLSPGFSIIQKRRRLFSGNHPS
jgi:hypothetical protein